MAGCTDLSRSPWTGNHLQYNIQKGYHENIRAGMGAGGALLHSQTWQIEKEQFETGGKRIILEIRKQEQNFVV
jgi:hypothetical protein